MTEAERIAREPSTNTHADMLRQWAGWIRDGASDLDVEDIDFEALTEAADEIDRLTTHAAEARRAGREEGLVEAARVADPPAFVLEHPVRVFQYDIELRQKLAHRIRSLASQPARPERATLTAAREEGRQAGLEEAAKRLDDLAATITEQAQSEETSNIELARMLDHVALNISTDAFAVRQLLASQPARPVEAAKLAVERLRTREGETAEEWAAKLAPDLAAAGEAEYGARPNPSPGMTAQPVGEWRPTHQHYKGGLYRKLFEATHEATLSPLIVYQNERGDVWVRPADDFNAILPDGQFRFAPLPPPPQGE